MHNQQDQSQEEHFLDVSYFIRDSMLMGYWD